MTIEHSLCRELDIRFIDARSIKNEAILSLKIDGYPTADQTREIQEEAIRIFRRRGSQDRRTMRRMNWDLEAVKIPAGAMSMSDVQDSGAGGSDATPSNAGSPKPSHSPIRRKLGGLLKKSRNSFIWTMKERDESDV